MKKFLSIIILFLLFSLASGQQQSFINPILPGSYPDPSICRVGDTFYIVNSSFEYFPGLPIHKSTDLVNWELIGYGLHRKDQCNGAVNLLDVNSNGGIHAPTIRFHNGLFYIITTNVFYDEKINNTDFVNFYITASDPSGPWSDPYVLDGAPGIDPDIFFDDDGRVWYVGTHAPENPGFPGEGEIWLQEIDLKNRELKGKRSFLWRGACGGVWAEGPHMYKKDGRYYLLIAEGGTSFNHAVMIAVSDSIRGPYIANERNPILTSRHLAYDNWVHSTGHADLVELADGRWYMVALGIRGDENRSSNMGRETHLIPVVWEREPFEWKEIKHQWPVAAPQTGKVERYNPIPFEGHNQLRNTTFTDNFDAPELKLQWNFRRVPRKDTYSLQQREGFLRLYANPAVIHKRGRYSHLGLRQTESDFQYEARMSFVPQNEGVASGISIIQKDDNFITYTLHKKSNGYFLQIILMEPDAEHKLVKEELLQDYNGEIILKIVSKHGRYHYFYSFSGDDYIGFSETRSNHLVSKGYTGAYLGIYITGNGSVTNDYSDFDWVTYTGFQRH